MDVYVCVCVCLCWGWSVAGIAVLGSQVFNLEEFVQKFWCVCVCVCVCLRL